MELVRACPYCNSCQIKYRVSMGNYKCYRCGEVFEDPNIRENLNEQRAREAKERKVAVPDEPEQVNQEETGAKVVNELPESSEDTEEAIREIRDQQEQMANEVRVLTKVVQQLVERVYPDQGDVSQKQELKQEKASMSLEEIRKADEFLKEQKRKLGIPTDNKFSEAMSNIADVLRQGKEFLGQLRREGLEQEAETEVPPPPNPVDFLSSFDSLIRGRVEWEWKIIQTAINQIIYLSEYEKGQKRASQREEEHLSSEEVEKAE